MADNQLKEVTITIKFSDIDDPRDPWNSHHFDEVGIKLTDEEADDLDCVIDYHAQQIQQYLISTYNRDLDNHKEGAA